MSDTTFDLKTHWEKIYTTKQLNEVSWYQPVPQTSLHLIENIQINKDDAIIDIGGGDSFLVDNLLQQGFTDVTVLDISGAAINRAKVRLGDLANKVSWIESNIIDFNPEKEYALWHDRAAFHFLNQAEDVKKYLQIVSKAMNKDGHMILGTFSDKGPLKCSGIEITQYTDESLTSIFSDDFDKINCEYIDHPTPFDTIQNFVFCTFSKRTALQ